MKTIILCGGLGTRLKEETEFKPKPMVYIGNKPILWHIMKIYSHYGYNEFILALGYKADYIKDYFLNERAFSSNFLLDTKKHSTKYYNKINDDKENFKITFVDTGLETLPGERILKCEKYIPEKDKYFMVTYGDGVSDINVRKVVDFHKKQRTLGTITAVHPRSKYGMVNISNKSLITKFIEKPVLADWVNGGYMVFSKKFFKYLRPGEYEHEALGRLSKENQLSAFKHNGFWFPIDTYKELEDLNKIWNSENIPWKVW